MSPHSCHRFRAAWQLDQFQQSVMGLERYEGLIIIDFVENYTSCKQREAQSFYWCRNQITIHPTMAYYYSGDGDVLKLQKEGIVIITDGSK